MNYLQQRLLEKESQVKSPILAAILGFFFPPIGYFYVRKYVAGVIMIIVEIFMIMFSLTGFGIPFLLLIGIILAYDCHKTANKINLQALKKSIEEKS
jgi:membrane-bound ClpP family serine protease